MSDATIQGCRMTNQEFKLWLLKEQLNTEEQVDEILRNIHGFKEDDK